MVLLTLSPLCARADASVEFDVHPRILRIGERATASFVIRGIQQPSLPQLPPIDGFQIGQPHTESSSSMQFINGRAQHDTSYTVRYSLLPMKAGTYTIGPYTYQTDGQSIPLPAVEVKVLPPRGNGDKADGKQTASQHPAIFARISTDRDYYFNQEVFDLYFDVYYRRGLRLQSGINIMNLPETGLRIFNPVEMRAQPVQMDNEIYDVKRFRCKTHALTAGTFHLDPVLRVPLVVKEKRRQRRGFFADMDMFFGGPEIQQVSVAPEPASLEIRPLPTAGQPADFTGAVGIYTFELQAKPTELQAGEPITITLRIAGAGNIANVVAPEFDLGEHFKKYDTRLISEDVMAAEARGSKVFEKVVIPRTDSIRQLPAMSFSYFNPASERYETLREGPIPLVVHPAAAGRAQMLEAQAEGTRDQAQILGADIIYLKPAPRKWHRISELTWYATPSFWTIQGIPLLGLAGLFVLLRRREGLRRDVARARRQRAPRSARAGLRKAEDALARQDTDGFYDGIWEALCSYYGNRLNLSPGEITPDMINRFLAGGHADASLRERLADVFQMCDAHRFAGGAGLDDNTQPGSEIIKTVSEAFKISEKIRT
jgi:hypothetical protein